MLKRLLAVITAVLFLSFLAACGNEDDTSADPASSEPASEASDAAEGECEYAGDAAPASKEVQPPDAEPSVSGEVPVTIATSAGDITATLDAGTTPCTVNSFVSLAEQEYFDATQCHRLTTAGIFVLQCGDPSATGSGGPGYQFDDELSGKETYGPGTLAMANAGPGTNGSQFFVVYEDSPLPPAYTVFGELDAASVKVVKQVAAQGSDNANGEGDGAPKEAVKISEVTAG